MKGKGKSHSVVILYLQVLALDKAFLCLERKCSRLLERGRLETVEVGNIDPAV